MFHVCAAGDVCGMGGVGGGDNVFGPSPQLISHISHPFFLTVLPVHIQVSLVLIALYFTLYSFSSFLFSLSPSSTILLPVRRSSALGTRIGPRRHEELPERDAGVQVRHERQACGGQAGQALNH